MTVHFSSISLILEHILSNKEANVQLDKVITKVQAQNSETTPYTFKRSHLMKKEHADHTYQKEMNTMIIK
jgi:hypothetical protein